MRHRLTLVADSYEAPLGEGDTLDATVLPEPKDVWNKDTLDFFYKLRLQSQAESVWSLQCSNRYNENRIKELEGENEMRIQAELAISGNYFVPRGETLDAEDNEDDLDYFNETDEYAQLAEYS